jgi:hypothetical protein
MPSTEPTLITRAGASGSAAARSSFRSPTVRWKTPSTLVLRTFSQPDAGNSSRGAPQTAPAFLTRMSSDSKRSRVAAASDHQADPARATRHQRGLA